VGLRKRFSCFPSALSLHSSSYVALKLRVISALAIPTPPPPNPFFPAFPPFPAQLEPNPISLETFWTLFFAFFRTPCSFLQSDIMPRKYFSDPLTQFFLIFPGPPFSAVQTPPPHFTANPSVATLSYDAPFPLGGTSVSPPVFFLCLPPRHAQIAAPFVLPPA